MSILKKTVVPVIAVLAAASTTVATAPAADAHASGSIHYVKGEPRLCSNQNNAVHRINAPFTVRRMHVQGMHRYNTAKGKVSLRTCDWKAQYGKIQYRCNRKSGYWRIAVVPRGEDGSSGRAQSVPMTCDKRLRTLTYGFSGKLALHVHLHTSKETNTMQGVTVNVLPPAKFRLN